MNDLISRAAARDVINTWGRHENEDVRMVLLHNDLNAIPAVEVPLRCHGCSFFVPHKHDMGDDSRCTMLNREVRENDYCAFGAWIPKER